VETSGLGKRMTYRNVSDLSEASTAACSAAVQHDKPKRIAPTADQFSNRLTFGLYSPTLVIKEGEPVLWR
jgi:hypothetical protein